MIYSRGIDIEGRNFFTRYWNRTFVRPLSKFKKLGGEVFYYDRHDLHLRKLEFNDFIDDDHWEQVREKNASILIDYSDDFFNVEDIIGFAKVLKERRIPNDRIFMLVMDPLWNEFATKHFANYGIKANISELPWLLYQCVRGFPEGLKKNPAKRTCFSMLSRNYRTWRLELFLNMLALGFDFNNTKSIVYSFHRVDPYEKIDYSIKDLFNDCDKLGFDRDMKRIRRWIKGTPYNIGSWDNKFFNGTYSAIKNSDINILIESHWDPYQTNDIRINFKQKYQPQEWAPSFLTEKFYKTILCQTPFLIVSTPYFLKDMKKLGYKTFPSIVNEQYDEIERDSQRSRTIASELVKLQRMPAFHFQTAVDKTQEAVIHNKEVMMEFHNRPVLTDEFLFLRKYINPLEFPNGVLDTEFVKG